MTTSTPVTVLGLGPMGQALAAAFLAHGHPTTVWNRTPEKADELVAAGATRAATVAEAVTAADLVVVCVIDYPAVHAIVDQAVEALRGRTLVNLTADSPDSAREMAAWATERGIDYLDGSIMSPTVTINTPAAVLLYSGPEQLYARHRDTLASLGGSHTHLGTDPGRAAAYDVALLDMFWTAMSGLAHGFALARAEGITGAELAPFAAGIAGLLTSGVEDHAQRVDENRHDGDFSSVESAAAGMAHVIHAADARGLDTGVLRAAHAIAQRAIDAGHGADSPSRLTDTMTPQPAITG
jgi:3-hydroxyisobutyrate dehydrogenase-like beta-hydroxyacid dehydrogenase